MTQNNKNIIRIEATCGLNCEGCTRKTFTWNKQTIGDIIKNIPDIIKLDNRWKNVKIFYTVENKEFN